MLLSGDLNIEGEGVYRHFTPRFRKKFASYYNQKDSDNTCIEIMSRITCILWIERQVHYGVATGKKNIYQIMPTCRVFGNFMLFLRI